MYFFDDFMWNVFPIIFVLLFVAVFLYIIVGNALQWHKNNGSPTLTVEAKVVTKRICVQNDFTHYYATFEVESGDRMEMQLSDTEYGQLVDGDTGRLHFQGTRYLGFDRC